MFNIILTKEGRIYVLKDSGKYDHEQNEKSDCCYCPNYKRKV